MTCNAVEELLNPFVDEFPMRKFDVKSLVGDFFILFISEFPCRQYYQFHSNLSRWQYPSIFELWIKPHTLSVSKELIGEIQPKCLACLTLTFMYSDTMSRTMRQLMPYKLKREFFLRIGTNSWNDANSLRLVQKGPSYTVWMNTENANSCSIA